MAASKAWERRRGRVFEIISVGSTEDRPSRAFDILYTLTIIVNLIVSVMYTFQSMRERCGGTLLLIEDLTVAFFVIDYVLRLYTARCLYPGPTEGKAVLKYALSFAGIVDLLSFLPYYLPVIFPAGAVAFRMFRVVRIFRLFRINTYYDSLNVIAEVIRSKSQQLISSLFIIMVLMLASSLCMYSLEHEAQPEVFTNAFSGVWWAVSTLLTVGYGDIYPITPMGQVFSIILTFLGVGLVAIPTGIISAGFVDQYSRIKRISEYANEEDIHFIKITLDAGDAWVGRLIRDLGLPAGIVVAVIQREGGLLVPHGDVTLQAGDTLVLGAESFDSGDHIELKELILKKQHPWNGQAIRDLDISRKTVIVMVKRGKKILIPNGGLVLREGDKIIMYTQLPMKQAGTIEI